MAKVVVNETEFNTYDAQPFITESDYSIRINLFADSLNDIATAAGEMTLEQVPERWREEVRKALGE